MTGWLRVVGIGPAGAAHRTPAAEEAIGAAEFVLGYGPYLDRVAGLGGAARVASDNREELVRAREALVLAAEGRRVAVVSGGDPGVFAMASAVMEAVEAGPAVWRGLDVGVVPGVTAMLAAASRLGAPLGHDFCAMSLSDNLKPWEIVLARLRAAAGAGFSLALYNPCSRARPWQLGAAFEALAEVLPGSVPVGFVHAALADDERVVVTTLGAARDEGAGMRTLVVVGTEASRVVERPGLPPLFYAPRAVAAA
jgi:precorrin-3B C17-methyltransferase